MKKFLFIIDPQNDFIEGGSLEVPRGKEALQRIVDSGILKGPWDKIIVSLDSHNPSHLGFGEPKTDLRKHLLRGTQRPTSWPPHCIIDTHGWEIYGPLQDKLMSMGDKISYVEKGESDYHDSYSIMDAFLMDPYFEEIINWIINAATFEEVEIYWTGLAEDYCVYESIKDIIHLMEMNFEDPKKAIKNILLSDMTACIKDHISLDGLEVR